MEAVKRYVFAYFDFPELNQDLRLMVASILWEYLLPLFVHDPAHNLIEQHLVQFFFELVNMPPEHQNRIMILVL